MRRELTDIRAALQRVTGGNRWNTVSAHTAANDPNGAGDAPHGARRYTNHVANGGQPTSWPGQQTPDEDDNQNGTTNFPSSPSHRAPGAASSPSLPTPVSSNSASMAYGGRAAFGAGSSQGQGEPVYNYPTTGSPGPAGPTESTQQQMDFRQAHPGVGGAGSGLAEWGSMPLLDSSPRGASPAEAGRPLLLVFFGLV